MKLLSKSARSAGTLKKIYIFIVLVHIYTRMHANNKVAALSAPGNNRHRDSSMCATTVSARDYENFPINNAFPLLFIHFLFFIASIQRALHTRMSRRVLLGTVGVGVEATRFDDLIYPR